MPRKRRILLVDPDISYHERWKSEMGNRFHIESVTSLEDARIALEERPTFALLAIETFEDDSLLHAIPFIQTIRQRVRKPIIGVASDYQKQLRMIAAGCTHYAKRDNLPETIYEVFRLL